MILVFNIFVIAILGLIFVLKPSLQHLGEWKLTKFEKMEIPRSAVSMIQSTNERKYACLSLFLFGQKSLEQFTESFHQIISIISFSGLAFNVQLGVLTLTIAEHSNGKRIQRHFAPCSRVMECV